MLVSLVLPRVDIDCYKLNVSVDMALEEIKRLIYKGVIPNPNLIIFSGRGLQLLFSISGGASPKMAFLSQYITAQFISELRHLGADTTGTDVTRVFRLPYSVNSRNGQQVTLEIWRKLEYSLQELYSFCKPLEQRRKPSKVKKGSLYTLPSQKGLMDIYSLNTARKNDLEMLVALRMGEIENRNVLTYVYSYTVALLLKNKEATIEFSIQLNNRLADPQKPAVVKRTSGNGYDDAIKFFEEFKKRDFTMWYKQSDGIKRPMKNETIIEALGITAEEMAQFGTVITAEEKYTRKVKKRRKQGVLKREEYLELEKNNTQKQIDFIRKQLAINPKIKQRELAEMLGVTQPRISKLIRELKI